MRPRPPSTPTRQRWSLPKRCPKRWQVRCWARLFRARGRFPRNSKSPPSANCRGPKRSSEAQESFAWGHSPCDCNLPENALRSKTVRTAAYSYLCRRLLARRLSNVGKVFNRPYYFDSFVPDCLPQTLSNRDFHVTGSRSCSGTASLGYSAVARRTSAGAVSCGFPASRSKSGDGCARAS